MSAQLRVALIIARREIAGYFHAPIAYAVAVLFLVLQGFSFWAVVSALADPARPAPLGAVLASHFGGTFLHWSVLVLLVSIISMRLVAEDRRQGTWESLLTAPVAEGAAIAGKWLGAVAFYALLWAPTLIYPVIVQAHAPAAARIDPGPLISAHAGVLLSGMALLGLGIAASAATANQIIAAVVPFVLGMLLVLVGEVPALAPGLVAENARWAAILGHMDVRAHMEALARGEVSSAAVALLGSVAVVGLVAATTIAAWGRRRPGELRRRLAATCLIAIIAACVNVLAARHPAVWDVTRARSNSLDERTLRLLADADGEPVEVLVLRAGLDVFADIQAEIERLLGRMVAAQPALRVQRLDAALEPDRVAALAAELAVPIENLRDGGVVVFQRGARRRAVDLFDMAELGADDLGVGALSRLRAEEAFAGALAEILDSARPVVCHTIGHGEAPLDPEDNDAGRPDFGAGVADLTGLGRRLLRHGGQLRAVDALAAGVPATCRVLIIAGPMRPLAAAEAMAVASYLAGGGRVLVALSEALAEIQARDAAVTPGFVDSGLALVLAEYGIALPHAAVVDPDGAVGGPGQWLTTRGYGAHAITSSFAGRRLTLWLHPRAVLLEPAAPGDAVRAAALVSSSASGWAERDLAALVLGRAQRDAGDLAGPVPVAVAVEVPATGARLVVFGGVHALSGLMAEQHGSAGELLAAAAVAWLGGHGQELALDDRTPEQLRLIMTPAELRRVFVICVIVLPASVALLGALLGWRRRRA